MQGRQRPGGDVTAGETLFTYSLAVTNLTGRLTQPEATSAWASDARIAEDLNGCEFTFLTMREMWSELQD